MPGNFHQTPLKMKLDVVGPGASSLAHFAPRPLDANHRHPVLAANQISRLAMGRLIKKHHGELCKVLR